LNIEQQFHSEIDWEFPAHGRLWTYNLNYLDCLLDELCTEAQAIKLMQDFLEAEPRLQVGKEPYPVSLRIFNWVKAMVRFRTSEPRFHAFLRCELRHLASHIEYHVMGNHLLENALALCFGGLGVGDMPSFEKGLRLLERELTDQILDDGAHQERSPMYQQILLERMLDCLNLALANPKGQRLIGLLGPTIVSMFTWLRGMTFADGSIAYMNDAVNGVSMKTGWLEAYAIALNLEPNVQPVRMGSSGYRRIDRGRYECIVDAGNLGPDHLLAHAHSDTLSFCLNYDGRPVIVDTGTSTYEEGPIRNYERSTRAHNTVMVDSREQSVPWSSFRVARRAYARILDEGPRHIRATHNGYDGIGVSHVREFRFEDTRLLIEDRVEGGRHHEAFLHFPADIEVECFDNVRIVAGPIAIGVRGANYIERNRYGFAEGFNRRREAWCVCLSFKGSLSLVIESI
jgi:uncharacterized heparinase superfamily protein